MAESLDFSLRFSIIGILIVFGALAIISVVVSLVRRADSRWQKHEEVQRDAAVLKEQSIDTTTLVLIVAAAATMIKGRFHIKSIRRLLPSGAASGPWSMQGRAILHGSHVIPRKR
jgi:Na+-transporting methylmalonyl-CoA/oxaloacetate decarboxylase gamma subunit